MINDEINSVSMKGVIVHLKNNPITVIMITIIIYMHLWHECQVMKKVVEGHHITAKQKVQVKIKMFNDNGYTFITTLYNVLLAPDMYDGLF